MKLALSEIISIVAIIMISFYLGISYNSSKYSDRLDILEQKLKAHKCIYTDTNYVWKTIDSVEHDCYGINPNYHKGTKQ